MANDINQVILVGRLTRAADLKYTGAGTAVCKFAIAVNRRRKSGDQWTEEAHFFDISLWGKRGEGLHQYLTKGKQVAVQGELRQNRWEHNGQSYSKIEIHANTVQLLGGGNSKNEGGGKPQNSAGPEQFEDDIPF